MDIIKYVEQAATIGIAGHVRPDGDCVGSCLGLYNYLQENLDADKCKVIDVYLESIPKEFSFLKNADKVTSEYTKKKPYDLFISLDSGSIDRLGGAEAYFISAKQNICIDHHISNTAFGMHNHVKPDASSVCEVLFDLFDTDSISAAVAECLYVGITHDTGVFKYSNTSEHTMSVAGRLITLGARPDKLIDKTFYEKTYAQNQILGRCLIESMLLMDGKVIVSYFSKHMQEFYNVGLEDVGGVIDQLRVTKGVEAAIFLKEESMMSYKVSMRSNGIVDVSKIAVYFGGGGHVLAAGCTMNGSLHDVINNLMNGIEDQLNAEQI